MNQNKIENKHKMKIFFNYYFDKMYVLAVTVRFAW